MQIPIATKYGWKTDTISHSHAYLLPVVLKHL
jgi:hypothetical protein